MIVQYVALFTIAYHIREVMQMSMQELIKQATEIKPGDHLVALYDEEKEIESYIAAYIHSSLSRNERCIYITGDADTFFVLQQIKALSKGDGVSGELVMLDKSEVYSKDGKFNPDKLISKIISLVETARHDGYTALSITGEISWVLDYDDGEALIIEYEWKLNEYIFNKYPVSALCRYNITKFSDEMIKNIIQVHPIIVWDFRIHENPYYIPPEGFKNNTIAKCQVDSWLKNIFNFTDIKSRFSAILEESREENRQLHQSLTNGIVKALVKLLETHDPYTKDHSTNVATLALKLSEKIDSTEEFKTKIYYVGLVHDIGKTLISKEILNKPHRLSVAEYNQTKLHSVYGSEALSQMSDLYEVSLAVRHHHEHFDGCGYPDGLSGTQIPLMSRIISICDSYDAITNDRPYRKAQNHQFAINEIMACSGKQFDPELVVHFVKIFQ